MSGAAHQPNILRRIRRFAGIVGAFLVVGPPLGGAVFFLIFIFMTAAQDILKSWQEFPMLLVTSSFWTKLPTNFLYVATAFFQMLTGFSVAGYIFGLVPALVVGLVIGIRVAFFGRESWREAALIGALVGLPYSFVIGWPVTFIPLSMGSTVLSVVICAVATVACWGMVCSRHFQPENLASVKA